MIIHVTQRDIDAAKHSTWCPVEHALLRRNLPIVCVNRQKIVFSDFNKPTPPLVIAFINSYDNGEPVKPFRFKLDD